MFVRFLQNREYQILFGACVVLFLLWLTGVRYPIISDTEIYALLGESVWSGNGYMLDGQPYAKHLPFHAIASYPIVKLLGYSLGMKLSSLLAGIAVLIATFVLISQVFDKTTALGTVVAVAFHHGFVWMTVVGSADLLFSALTLFSLICYVKAETNARWYLGAGLLLGLACLTRYNGVPLFALYGLWVIWKRRSHLQSKHFWQGMVGGCAVFYIWLARNKLLFGSALYSDYTGELSKQAPSLWDQFGSNLVYYGNPLHNVLPILLVFGLYGIWKQRRERLFLILAMAFLISIAAIWWVQAMRFVFVAFPILIAFAVHQLRRVQGSWLLTLGLGLIVSHLFALCMYSSGQCNALFDRTIGRVPASLGITSEGFYSWSQARDYINENAEDGAFVDVGVEMHRKIWTTGVFREDLTIIAGPTDACPIYSITTDLEDAVFTTESAPQTGVVRKAC